MSLMHAESETQKIGTLENLLNSASKLNLKMGTLIKELAESLASLTDTIVSLVDSEHPEEK